ncbi:FtsX-like permease family protein [Nonomuraea antimicrobica]
MEALRAAVTRAVEPYNAPGLRIARVAVGADRGGQENNIVVAEGFNTLWFLVWVTALVSAGMVAAAMGLSVRRRGMEIAVLRAVGARPGQIRRMLVAEAVLLAVVATLVAIPLGMLLAPAVVARFRDFGTVSVAFEVGYHPLAMWWTFALTLAIALVASLASVRRALRIRPGDALGEAPAEGRRLGRGRLAAGSTLLAGAGVLSAVQVWKLVAVGGVALMGLQFGTLCLAVAGVGLVAPWVVLVSGKLVRGVVARLSPVAGFLAVANVVFNHRRFAGAVGSLALGVTLVGTVVGTQLFYDWRTAAHAVEDVRADHVLRPSAGQGALSEELRRRVLDRDGTSAAVGIASMPVAVSVEGRPPGQDPPPATATLVTGDITRVLDLSLRGRSPGDLGEGEVAVSESLGAELGSLLRVRIPGEAQDARYTVVAVYADTAELGSVSLPAQAVAGTNLPSRQHERIYVRGADPGPLADPRVPVESFTKQEYFWQMSEESAQRNRTLPYVSLLVALLCLVAAINSLCMGLLDRRREFTGLRHLGTRRRQVMRMACWEGLFTVAPVVVLALAVTAWVTFVHAVSEPGGAAATLSLIPFDWLVPLGAGALAAAMAGSLLVVRAALRNERHGTA